MRDVHGGIGLDDVAPEDDTDSDSDSDDEDEEAEHEPEQHEYLYDMWADEIGDDDWTSEDDDGEPY